MSALLALTLLAAASLNAEPQIDCSKPSGVIEINNCAYRDYQAADAEMNAQWRKALLAAEQIDQENSERRLKIEKARDALLRAQRAFLIYRQETCNLREIGQADGTSGNIGWWEEAVCLIKMTKQRTQQLQNMSG